MSVIVTIQGTVATEPKTRTVTVGDQEKQVTDLFLLITVGRKKNPDGSYEDVSTPAEVAIWNGVGSALVRDGLSKGDRIALSCRLKGSRPYTSSQGELKSVLSLEYADGAPYPLVQKAKATASPAF